MMERSQFAADTLTAHCCFFGRYFIMRFYHMRPRYALQSVCTSVRLTNPHACCCFTLFKQSPDGASGFIRLWRISFLGIDTEQAIRLLAVTSSFVGLFVFVCLYG